VRFHTETNYDSSSVTIPTTIFLNWVKALLPKDKYNVFLHLFKFPLQTPSIIENVYRELGRVFESRNSAFAYQFSQTEYDEDWRDYRQNKLNEPNVWKTVGWQHLKTAPNSILIVDIPPVQSTLRPEPYFYWLNIEDVIDYDVQCDGTTLNWIAFRQPGNVVAVFDDTFYRTFQLAPGSNGIMEIQSQLTESAHELGYCPARFFWSTPINECEKDIKKNPIFKELSTLDWLLYFSISKQHLDLYAPYPIVSTYASECHYENTETGSFCDGGFLRNENGDYIVHRDNTLEPCPLCSHKRLVGPGSTLEVPIPSQTEGIADLGNPVHITTIDADSLKYNVSEVERLEDRVILSLVGTGGASAVSQKEAINETQVAANFESKTSVLMSLKSNFEAAQKFVEDTICRLRYGSDFISSAVSWGTEFYVFTIGELYSKFGEAKTNGASSSELSAIANQILEVEYKDNPLVLRRMQILKQLEPYPHLTLDEMLNLSKLGILNQMDAVLKINFATFVDRFERENINILEFGRDIKFSDKIDKIKTVLYEYAKEKQQQEQIGAPSPQTGAGSEQSPAASNQE